MKVINFVLLDEKAKKPTKATNGSAGWDIYAIEPTIIGKNERLLMRTGLAIALPEGYYATIVPRSGLAKEGITITNTPATIDEDYRGEIHIILENRGKSNRTIKEGDRIAQMIIHKREEVGWVELDSLPETKRGQNGFGSTGR